MNKLMDDVSGKKEQNVIETLALRSMAKAIYSTENIGHYGLSFSHYTHFTSPIRRYPDMMVHRLLTRYLEEQPSRDAEKYRKAVRVLVKEGAPCHRCRKGFDQIQAGGVHEGQDRTGF